MTIRVDMQKRETQRVCGQCLSPETKVRHTPHQLNTALIWTRSPHEDLITYAGFTAVMCYLYTVEIHLISSEERMSDVFPCAKTPSGIVLGCSEWLSGCCYAVARWLLTSVYCYLVWGPSMQVYVILCKAIAFSFFFVLLISSLFFLYK